MGLGAIHHVVKDLTVATTGTYYSKSFKMAFSSYFGIWVQATAASGTPDVKIELEESYEPPTTEGSSDTDYVEPDGFSDIFSSINDQLAHIKTVSPVPMKYGRFKITGINANPSGTVLNIRLFMQEDYI